MKDEYQLSFDEVNLTKSLEIKTPNSIILLIDKLADPSNIGTLFRLADATNIEGIYGYKTDLELKSKKIEAVSRQTSRHIPFKELKELNQVIQLSKDFHPIALEYTNKSIPFTNYSPTKPIMLIIGNEKRGICPELLELAQTSLHVPMFGKNSSMNVSVATGIALYHLIGNRHKLS